MGCRYCLKNKDNKQVTEKKILNNKTLARIRAKNIAVNKKKK